MSQHYSQEPAPDCVLLRLDFIMVSVLRFSFKGSVGAVYPRSVLVQSLPTVLLNDNNKHFSPRDSRTRAYKSRNTIGSLFEPQLLKINRKEGHISLYTLKLV